MKILIKYRGADNRNRLRKKALCGVSAKNEVTFRDLKRKGKRKRRKGGDGGGGERGEETRKRAKHAHAPSLQTRARLFFR